MQLVVHGGAGSWPDEPVARQAVLQDAADTGAAASGPLDAVVSAVGVLEESPRFNAGVGGAVQADGVVRSDAGVMTGDRAVGGVCSMPGVVNAAAVARAVLERTPHVLVSGGYAAELAEHVGVETDRELLTDDTRQRFAEADPPESALGDVLDWVNDRFGQTDQRAPRDHDTVGAVAVRDDGALAAATSTGGRWFALPGRVGDTPQVGAGFYAAAAGGASATGHGEDIARVTLSREAVRRIEDGADPQEAAEASVAKLGEETGGDAGIILADRAGRVGSAYNTDLMQTATASGPG
jgi:beta-aspartyl-peptidase (threonine type)